MGGKCREWLECNASKKSTNVIETVFYSAVGLVCLFAMSNWRIGLYLLVVMDVLRDPVRKMSETKSIWITLSVNAIWVAILVGMVSQSSPVSRLVKARPRLKLALQLLVFSLLPGAAVSIIKFSQGWKLAMIGAAAYLVPLIGIPIGFMLGQSPRHVERLLLWYCTINSLALTSVVLEYMGIEHAVLGGIDKEWIRYRADYTVKLISGAFRGPDVMGLHAAFVAMFAGLLVLLRTKIPHVFLYAFGMWSGICLLLCGRRKMIGIPFVFAAALILLTSIRSRRGASRARLTTMFFATGIAIVLFGTKEVQISEEYISYAATLFTEGASRTNDVIGGSVMSTWLQSGALGNGLGMATQGRYHVVGNVGHSWQEDGVSRFFAELGIPGIMLIGIAASLFFRQIRVCWYTVPLRSHQEPLLIGMLSVVIAAMASFAVSHQVFTGDPCSAIWVVMCLGVIFGCEESCRTPHGQFGASDVYFGAPIKSVALSRARR